MLATFVVTSTDGSGTTLSEAISAANASAGPDTINFAIPADDPRHFYYTDDGVAGTVTAANVTNTIASDDATISDIDPDWPHSWWSIRGSLPNVSGQVLIDGYSQGAGGPQAAVANSNGPGEGMDAVLRIELDGVRLVLNGGGSSYGGGSTVRGLVMNRNAGPAITLNNRGNTVQGNFIGTDPSGTLAQGNSQRGIHFNAGGFHRIGTDGDGTGDAAERNLISGNRGGFGSALRIESSSDNVIAGNFIGTDRSGSRAVSNFSQAIIVYLAGGTGAANRNRIGTNGDGVSDDLERNIISGTAGSPNVELPWGIQIRDSVSNNVVAGNYIGTDVTGTQAIGNALVGVVVTLDAFNTRIGLDPTHVNYEAERNVISGNALGGVILGDGARNNMVWGNYIGTQADGVSPLGNGEYGVAIGRGPTGNQIGGAAPRGNVIAFNGGSDSAGPGVVFTNRTNSSPDSTPPSRNPVRGNSIHSNNGLGIDLGANFLRGASFEIAADGVTPNDLGDGDSGPNRFQNFPVLTSAQPGANTRILGTLNSTPNQTFTLDFYANTALDPSGYGEGERYLGFGTVVTDANGDVAFDITLPSATSAGEYIAATATSSPLASGNTSEFSVAILMEDGDGVSEEVEDGAPNGGDGNGDDIPDSQQSNVTSLPTFLDEEEYVTLVSPATTTLASVSAIDNPSPSDAPEGVEFPVGFFEFMVAGVVTGSATTVTVLLPDDTNVNTYYKFGPTPDSATPHWYEFLFDGTTGAIIDAGPDADDDPEQIILHFEDGERGDGDLAANGIVLDPGTAAYVNHSPVILSLVNSSPGGQVSEGALVTIAARFSDANPIDVHTAEIDWGDGQTAAGAVDQIAGLVTGSHVYAQGGIYTVTINLFDGTESVAATTIAVIAGAGIQDGVLRIIGTNADDHVSVNKQGNGLFKVHANFLPDGLRTFSTAAIDQILVFLNDGDDHATLAGNITTAAILDGGEGSDHLNGGGGSTIVLGGGGDDYLYGSSVRDILIGGTGADRIVGGSGEDILIAGGTEYDDDYDILRLLLAEWVSDLPYHIRISHLTLGGGLNGLALLNDASISGDGAADSLTGGSDRDWFFANLNEVLDKATDHKFGE